MSIKINREALKKLAALGSTFVIAGSMSGCNMKYETAVVENYNTIKQSESSDIVNNGIENIIDVEGENFKLIAQYKCNSLGNWLITADKELYIKTFTKDLPEGYEVYIDNVHIDTFILSDLAVFNGIRQDTMDDRIHNSLMLGFPINNTTCYYGVNNIEGMNQEFIQGTMYGYRGYVSGSITEKRYLESDYREWGVYGNKISIVYDLLVKGPNDKEFRNISVMDKIIVEASSYEEEYLSKEEAKGKRLEKTK